MSKNKAKNRAEIRSQNLAELRKLYRQFNLEVLELSPSHFRIIGENTVDYWPSTNRAWLLGDAEGSKQLQVAEVCGLAIVKIDPSCATPTEKPKNPRKGFREVRLSDTRSAFGTTYATDFRLPVCKEGQLPWD